VREPVHAFAEMGFPAALTRELEHRGITVPFPIQAAGRRFRADDRT
jgi:superfamily II DNA/RNA helicase